MTKSHATIYTTRHGPAPASQLEVTMVELGSQPHPVLRRLGISGPAVIYDSPTMLIASPGVSLGVIEDVLFHPELAYDAPGYTASPAAAAVTDARAATVVPTPAREGPLSAPTPALVQADHILASLHEKIATRTLPPTTDVATGGTREAAVKGLSR